MKSGVADPQMPPSGQILYGALVPVCTYQCSVYQI